MIAAHIIDQRGVYLRTEYADQSGPQPAGAVYGDLPDAQEGFARMWISGAWAQVENAQVPPMPGPVPAPVPQKVTRRQARQALLLDGRLDDVQPAIDGIQDPVQRRLAQIEWDDSQDFERQRPLLIQLGSAIGYDDAGLDRLFTQAAGL